MRRLTNWVATSRRSAFSVNIIVRAAGRPAHDEQCVDGCYIADVDHPHCSSGVKAARAVWMSACKTSRRPRTELYVYGDWPVKLANRHAACTYVVRLTSVRRQTYVNRRSAVVPQIDKVTWSSRIKHATNAAGTLACCVTVCTFRL